MTVFSWCYSRTCARKATTAVVALAIGGIVAVACGARSELPVPEWGLVRVDICGSSTSSITPAPLDTFLVLDASTSMLEETVPGVTRWQAQRDALASFLLAPETAEMGAALTIFPRFDGPEPTDSCFSPTDCHDRCVPVQGCAPSFEQVCGAPWDCGDGEVCTPFGFCDTSGEYCDPWAPETCAGTCTMLGMCDDALACEPEQFTTADVPLDVLPGAAAGILAAIDAREPDGATSTLPALAGTIEAAVQRAKAEPTRKTIVVLATDGVPTVCDDALVDLDLDAAITHLADAAAAGRTRGVQTFVIGVLTPPAIEAPRDKLDAVAAAGGTSTAFVVTSGEPLGDELIAALHELRFVASSCAYELPEVDGLPDWDGLHVRVTPPAGEPAELEQVPSREDCDDADGGFHLDHPPGGAEPPLMVELCPGSCAEALGGEVEITLACLR